MAKLKLKFSNLFAYLGALVFGVFTTPDVHSQEDPNAAGEDASSEARESLSPGAIAAAIAAAAALAAAVDDVGRAERRRRDHANARDERAGNILGLRAGKKRLARRVAELLRELREA